MPQYNRAELGRIATESGFVRDTFEKVLRLKEILRFFNEDEFLREHLLLKGGTAINLTVFNLPRLSVDIDMDYTPNDTREDMLECRVKITEFIKKYMESEGLFENQRDLFRKCFVFYMTISADTLNKSFDTSAINTLDFNKIRRDLFPVLNKKDNFQLDERKKLAKDYIANLMILSEEEQEYLDKFEQKKYMPELLFDTAEIIERVKNHPMALWRCKE